MWADWMDGVSSETGLGLVTTICNDTVDVITISDTVDVITIKCLMINK